MTGERQKNQQMAFMVKQEGEAQPATSEGNETAAGERQPKSPTSRANLMEEILERKNLEKALKRVKSNKGSPGIDAMKVLELPGYLKENWPRIKQELLEGRYKPQPVKRVEIDKPGGGVRKLGIPTVLDRFLQQAVMQVLQQQWDSTFSEHSYGFRPGKSAHQAIAQAQQYISEGYRIVVDIDLEKFFDRVNHDRLMSQIEKRVEDKRVLKLIRGFLNSGVMEQGLVSPTDEGVPQGGPLSPLLSNLVLDELDKELERRGHKYCRFADDCNIYVSSQRAGQRVMESISKYITSKLKLRVNQLKSAVGKPRERKFLGFRLTGNKEVKRAIAPKAIERFKEKVRELTRRTKGKSVKQVVEDLAQYLKGWKSYFGYCQTPSLLKRLDCWIRHRLRSLVWKQWELPKKRYSQLRKRGVSHSLAITTANSRKGPWPISQAEAMSFAFPNAFFRSLGLPELSA